MRGADMGDEGAVLALSALWVGLLYDDASLDGAWELVKDWTDAERQALRVEVPRTALKTKFRNRTVAEIADDVLALACEGLERRARLNVTARDETRYLAPVERILSERKTQAERWLDRYNGEWAGDITKIFDEAEI
jgi:glutamate--cysteine ligase